MECLGKILTATLVAYITGNIAFGFIAGAIQIILELISGDLIQKDVMKLLKFLVLLVLIQCFYKVLFYF